MKKSGWNLRDVLPEVNSREYKNLLDELEKNVKFIENYREKLDSNIDINEFMSIIRTNENISETIARLCDYSYLWFSENTADQKAKSFRSNVEQISVNVGNRIMFFSLWFKSLDDTNAQRIINGVPNEYKYFLKFIRLLKPHTLAESEEKIINIKDTTGGNALIKLYDIITNNFIFTLNIKGKRRELTRQQLTTYVKDKDPKIRKAAYQELYRIYSKHSDVLNEIYRNVVLDWKNESINLRHYQSPISVRNKANDISDKAVSALIDVCRKNRFLFHEYFKLKAKICKIKKMTRYDIYASHNEKKEKIKYDEGKKMVFSAYKNYSDEMYNLAKKIVDSNHIDYEIRRNKMGGAYCMYISPKIVPYVLLNYDGDIRDVFTMAHELGHGVHDLLTSEHSILTGHPPLTLAETASVFGEMLLFDDLMKNTKDKNLRKTLLLQKLDDTYATILRQIYFIIFEIEAHKVIANESADLNKLSSIYISNLKEQFGNSVKIPEEFKYEWLSIPHIYHTPFYCYSYVFGYLLVFALYEKYRKEGKSFVPKYLKILKYGGSESPAKILGEVGIDVQDEKFWQGGFDLVKEMLNELKKL
ncbi:M3 family oligoendopeptidase [Candidatus Woesearchaeota archaeon]|nr:M3 family oligoendopeptidase [Candidatus Woesearchaeota archaeon]